VPVAVERDHAYVALAVDHQEPRKRKRVDQHQQTVLAAGPSRVERSGAELPPPQDRPGGRVEHDQLAGLQQCDQSAWRQPAERLRRDAGGDVADHRHPPRVDDADADAPAVTHHRDAFPAR
jgi:hypothetical protein